MIKLRSLGNAFPDLNKGAVMLKKWVLNLFVFLGSSLSLAQTPWPLVQSQIYPRSSEMKLIRHEQSVLLGEGMQQTGLFFATSPGSFSERIQAELLVDASRKGWKLHSIMRAGADYNLSFSQGHRILDIRLSNGPQGVDAVYSVVPNQLPPAIAPMSPGVPKAMTLSEPAEVTK